MASRDLHRPSLQHLLKALLGMASRKPHKGHSVVRLPSGGVITRIPRIQETEGVRIMAKVVAAEVLGNPVKHGRSVVPGKTTSRSRHTPGRSSPETAQGLRTQLLLALGLRYPRDVEKRRSLRRNKSSNAQQCRASSSVIIGGMFSFCSRDGSSPWEYLVECRLLKWNPHTPTEALSQH